MPIDLETSLRLRPCDERCEENDRCVLQFRVGTDLRCDFASVSIRHDHIKQDQVGPKIPGALMSVDRVVLFKHEILTCFFEKDFDHVSAIPVIINDQDTSLFVDS